MATVSQAGASTPGGAGIARYPGLSAHWRERFGAPVHRVGLDAGLSCPNRDGSLGTRGCAFCDPASFALCAGDPRPVPVQLAAGIERLRRRGVDQVAAYFQPHTNTYAPLPRLRELWDGVLPFPEVVALCVGTRPDCVPDPVLDLLGGYRTGLEIWLELGLQSARDDTLARLGRRHTAADFADACARAKRRGLRVCAHVILGLPGEGPEEEGRTAAFLAGMGIDGVKLHQLAVIRGTPLEGPWRAGVLATLSEDDYVERAAAFVRRLPAGTVLHRLVGDAPADRLLAPHFEKGRVVQRIREALRA